VSVLDDLRELKVFFDFAYICLSFDCAFPWCIQEALTFRRTSPLNSLVLVFEDLLTKGVGDHLTDHPWYRQNWIRPEKAVDWTTADIEWSAYLYSFAGNQGSFGQWIDHVSLCLCLPWLLGSTYIQHRLWLSIAITTNVYHTPPSFLHRLHTHG
jgi:hypothetical protein